MRVQSILPRGLYLTAALAVSQINPGCSGEEPPDEETDILEQLEQIEGLTVEEKPAELPGYRYFYLYYAQPQDHGQPEGQQFTQRLTLLHRDADAPLVVYSSGYFVSTSPNRVELTQLLDGNQLAIEHRFFEPSRPAPADWSTLTIEQSAADFHRIMESIGALYSGRRVGTGGSKGGMTALFHRRFYPADLDATVAYVAPISLDDGDDRFVTFIEQVGDEACRQQITTFQREVLLRRESMLDRLDQLAAAEGLSYQVLGEDMALEHATLESRFFLWQYFNASVCDDIPGPTASDDEIFGFLDAISGMAFFSDDVIQAFEAYYHQASVQLGYPTIAESAVADLLLYPGTDIAPEYVSPELPLSYDPESMRDILDWVDAEGERLMLIYGENDPWTAAAIPLGGAGDSYSYTVPEGNHGAKILQLPEPEKSEAIEHLERWMERQIVTPPASQQSAPGFIDARREWRERGGR